MTEQGYNIKKCSGLHVLANMLGLEVLGFGIHGSVPYIYTKYGYIYEWEDYYPKEDVTKISYATEGWEPKDLGVTYHSRDGMGNYTLEI